MTVGNVNLSCGQHESFTNWSMEKRCIDSSFISRCSEFCSKFVASPAFSADATSCCTALILSSKGKVMMKCTRHKLSFASMIDLQWTRSRKLNPREIYDVA